MRTVNTTQGAPPGRYRYDWDDVVSEGKANPGVWIVSRTEMKHSVYGVLSRGGNRKFETGAWRFATSGTRFDIDGKRWCLIHFKYIGSK